MDHIEKIKKGNQIYAIVLRKEFSEGGVNFFTPGEFSQQVGILIHKKGKTVKRHRHKLVRREILRTKEVLVVLEGKMRVDVYNNRAQKLKTVILNSGDAIILARGGHGVKILEDSKIIEVKQGPYAGYNDKKFF
jgi:quercetin dioxygenase-like cupin family protein